MVLTSKWGRILQEMSNQLKFVHSADKLAEMRTKFHVIQAKLIMSVWCFTVQCTVALCLDSSGYGGTGPSPGCSVLPHKAGEVQSSRHPATAPARDQVSKCVTLSLRTLNTSQHSSQHMQHFLSHFKSLPLLLSQK